MNRRKYLYALFIVIAVVSSGCLVGATVNGITMQWVKQFWVRQPLLPVECEIEIQGPRVVGCPVYINVTLKTKDDVTCFWGNITGNLTVDLYWCNWTNRVWPCCSKIVCDVVPVPRSTWQHVATLLPETEVTITQEEQTWDFEYTPHLTGLYKVVVEFATKIGTESFTSEY